jgi:2-amino-4-hydroxy-6-hydroxymethyldihydropteridine diphosphokinase
MTSTIVYLSLGSNIGNREASLRKAIAALPAAGVRVTRVSSIYETQPVDYLEQPWFLNCVVEGETSVPPLDLLRAIREIEMRLGSKKEVPKGPRRIDIDILLYGETTINTPELHVPHPRMTQRRFVLAPLSEVAPQLHHPSWSGVAVQMLAAVVDQSEVRIFASFLHTGSSSKQPS